MEEKKSIKIVGLNGSPNRKGNTVTLMKWVLGGCVEAGAAVELLHVCDYNIDYCLGCNCCLKEGLCPLEDDYSTVTGKLLEADGIVVGSPVYADAPTALLKTLMDRMTLLVLYTALFEDKPTVGVATSGFAPTKGVAKKIAMFGQRCGVIGANTTTFKRGPQPLDRFHKPNLPLQANKTGKKLVCRILSGRRVLNLDGLWIHVLRKYFLSKLVAGHPDFFAAVIKIRPDLYGAAGKK